MTKIHKKIPEHIIAVYVVLLTIPNIKEKLIKHYTVSISNYEIVKACRESLVGTLYNRIRKADAVLDFLDKYSPYAPPVKPEEIDDWGVDIDNNIIDTYLKRIGK